LSHQTLLGVTGSGKSVGYDDPLYVIERRGHERIPQLVKAGPFIDSLIAAQGLDSDGGGETERYACAQRNYWTLAYDPSRGATGEYPVAAFLRHRAPSSMFRLRTRCGREATLTGDHNLWVLRDGRLKLIRTEEATASDFLPMPETLEGSEEPARSGSLREIDILPYLADTSLSVHAETAIMQYAAAGGYGTAVAATRACDLDPYAKLRAIRQRVHGRGVKVRHFLQLLAKTGNLGDTFGDAEIYVGGEKESCRLRARLRLTDSFLGLLGNYIADGHGQRG
jgi:hypothetical protein